jgi:hypothetical protein
VLNATERRVNQRPGITKKNCTLVNSPMKKSQMLPLHMIPTAPGKLGILQDMLHCFETIANRAETSRETTFFQPSLVWKAFDR